MTSWPEQPPTGQPQTRRQAREFERSASRRAGTAEPTPAGQIPDVTTTVPPREPEPAAQQDAAADAAKTDAAQQDAAKQDAPKSDAPKSDAAQQAAAQQVAPNPAAVAPAAQQPAEQKAAQQKPNEPERPAIPASAFAEPGVTSPSRDAFDLFRQGPDASRPEPVTQPMAILQTPTAPAESAGPASALAAPAAAAAPASSGSASATQAAPERTLTRRELRAMLQAQEANAQANHPGAPGEAVFPVSFTADADADSEGDSAESVPAGANSAPSVVAQDDAPASPAPTSEKSPWPFAPLTPTSAPTGARAGEPEPTVTQSTASPFAAFGTATTPKAPAVEPAPAQADEREDASPADSLQERRPFTPPTGHWSTAAELDDQNQPITSRNVAQSTAATTTNALILPVIPQPNTNAPLTSTGEILVTGSIDLPRGMGATGAHPDRIDSSDLDRLLDGEENEFNTSEVQPVRASRAISTHTSTRGVIAPPKKRGNTLPVVLMVTAGVLAVGVIGLLVAAYVLKVF